MVEKQCKKGINANYVDGFGILNYLIVQKHVVAAKDMTGTKMENDLILDIKNEARQLAIKEIEMELLAKQDYSTLSKLQSIKETNNNENSNK